MVLDKSIRTLEEKERNLSNLSASGRDNTKEFVSDVIAHQGDLRKIYKLVILFLDCSVNYMIVFIYRFYYNVCSKVH